MDKIVRGLELVEKINSSIKDLQKSLELFKRGQVESALEEISRVEEGIEGLRIEDLPARQKIECKLSEVKADLEWVSENAEKVEGGETD